VTLGKSSPAQTGDNLMQNRQLWEAMLEYLEGQVHVERTPRTATMGPVQLTMCNECRAALPDQDHLSGCATGKLINFIKAQLEKEQNEE
jgi:hypothetical protein